MPIAVNGSAWQSLPSSRKWRLTDSQAPRAVMRHALVVVAGRAARGEGVAEPVAVLQADRVGDVGEGGGALVGRDHEVGIVLVVAHHARRRHDLLADPVVGDVEHAAHQGLVAGHDLGVQGGAVAAPGRLLDHEAALGADRHDHAVLDHLRLHQAQHLGPKVLAPVRPADAAARDLAAAQMHALHARRVDEDLVGRVRQRHVGHRRRLELEREIGLVRRALGTRLIEVGAQHGADQAQIAPQDAVLVEIGDRVQALADAGDEALHLGRPIAAQVRIEARREQQGELAGKGRVGGQGLLHVGLAVRAADLEEVLAAGAQHRDLAPVEPGAEHELVEAVVLRIAAPHPGERVLEIAPDLVDVDLAGLGALHREVVHREAAAVLGHEAVRPLVDDPQAHVLEHRQDVGQGNARAGAAELEADQGVVVLERAIERHLEIALAPGDPVDAGEVGDRGARRHLLLIGERDRVAIGAIEPVALLLAVGVDQRVAQQVGPGARGLEQLALELLRIDVPGDAVGRAHDELDAGQDRFRKLRLEVDLGAVERPQQDLLVFAPQHGVPAIARHVDQAGDEAREGVAPDEQPDALALLQMQDLVDGLEQLVVADLEQLVARVGLDDVGQRLAGMAGGRAGWRAR